MPAFCSLLFNQLLSTFIFVCSLSYVAFICITTAVSLLTEGKTIIVVFFFVGMYGRVIFFHTQTCLSGVNNYLWQTCPTEDVGTSSVISALKELVCSLFNSFFLYTIHIFCGSNIFMRKLFPSSPKMVLFTSRL